MPKKNRQMENRRVEYKKKKIEKPTVDSISNL